MELPNQDKIRTLGENETNKYLGILEADTIKRVEMKDKIQKEYLRRTRKLLETKLSVKIPLVIYITFSMILFLLKSQLLRKLFRVINTIGLINILIAAS